MQRFYFRELLEDSTGYDEETSAVSTDFRFFDVPIQTKEKENKNLLVLGSYKDISNLLVTFQLHSVIEEVAAAKARMFVNKREGSMYFMSY